jgi:hypothetical protein
MEFYTTKIRPWLGIIAFFLIGITMVKDPHLFDHAEASGRHSLMKLIFSYIWGIPAGVIVLLLGTFFAYNQIKGTPESSSKEE